MKGRLALGGSAFDGEDWVPVGDHIKRAGCCDGGGNTRVVLEGGAVVRPGDRLIVRTTQPLDPATVAAMTEWLEANCPGVQFLAIVAADLLVYRPDEVKEAGRG